MLHRARHTPHIRLSVVAIKELCAVPASLHIDHGSSRVTGHISTNIVHLAMYDDPAVTGYAMFGNLRNGENSHARTHRPAGQPALYCRTEQTKQETNILSRKDVVR
jgi:hypothetical protein